MLVDENARGHDDLCAIVAQKYEVPPIGNSPGSEIKGYLFIEFPLPWRPKIEETPDFPLEVVELARKRGFKLHGMVTSTMESEADTKENDEFYHVLIYERPLGPLKRYRKIELQIPREKLAKIIENVLLGSIEDAKDYLVVLDDDIRDVFVCIHGSRDFCCCKFGKKLLEELKEKEIDNVRFWGVSHVGKHFLAPNVLMFPEGQFWGHVNSGIIEKILSRSGSIEDVVSRYRGTIGFDPPIQVLEVEVLKREGWTWFDYHRQGWITSENGIDGTYNVVIDYFDDQMSKMGSYEGQVKIVKSKQILTTRCSMNLRYKLSTVIQLTQKPVLMD